MTNKNIIILTLSVIALILVGGVLVWQVGKVKQALPEIGETKKPEVSAPATPEGEKPEVTEPETIDTSDWKVYRNEEYGFEFKYPNELGYVGELSRDTEVLSDIKLVLVLRWRFV